MSSFLAALKNENQEATPPVWLMRQAGRYMASYRQLRKKYSFIELCKNPELIYQVTKLPIDTFDFDAAIIFSDILYITELFGQKVIFDEKLGPVITPAISTPDDVSKLFDLPLSEALDFVFSGIRLWKKEEKKPLIGFAGAPFTVACYMIEGKMGKNFLKTKQFYYTHQASFFTLLDRLTDRTIEYLNAQIDAGVDAIQLFDSWAQLLPWGHYTAYSDRWLRRLLHGLKPCPRIYFCRGASSFYEQIATLPFQAISLDWQCDPKRVRQKVSCALQGNLDPEALLGDPNCVRQEVRRIVDSMKGDPGFIFNLGHGVLKETPEKNIHVLVDAVRHVSNA